MTDPLRNSLTPHSALASVASGAAFLYTVSGLPSCLLAKLHAKGEGDGHTIHDARSHAPSSDKEKVGQPVEVAAHDVRDLAVADQRDDAPLRPAAHGAGHMQMCGAEAAGLHAVRMRAALRDRPAHTHRQDKVAQRGQRSIELIDPLLQLLDVRLCEGDARDLGRRGARTAGRARMRARQQSPDNPSDGLVAPSTGHAQRSGDGSAGIQKAALDFGEFLVDSVACSDTMLEGDPNIGIQLICVP